MSSPFQTVAKQSHLARFFDLITLNMPDEDIFAFIQHTRETTMADFTTEGTQTAALHYILAKGGSPQMLERAKSLLPKARFP